MATKTMMTRDLRPFDDYMSSDKEPPISSAYLANPSGEE